MKSVLPNSILFCILNAFIFIAIGCNPDEIATKKAVADKKAVGRWHLTGIKSGWTGTISLPVQQVNLSIDQQQQGIIYESGTAVIQFHYVLEDNTPGTLRYSINQQTGTSTNFYPPSRGNFRVSSKQLIIGDTGVDGNDYIFEKI